MNMFTPIPVHLAHRREQEGASESLSLREGI